MKKRLNLISYIIITIIVLVFIIGIVYLSAVSIEWLTQLDKVLDPTLFATLAGLALATAGMIQNSHSDLFVKQNELIEDEISSRKRIKDTSLKDEADRWYLENKETLSYEVIEDSIYKYDIKQYLTDKYKLAKFNTNFEQSKLSKSTINIAFLSFIIGLVETLTLDILVDSTQIFNDKISSLGSFVMIIPESFENLIYLTDIILGSIFMIIGIFYLIKTAAALKTES